jgi:hypothetical protein
MSQTSSRTISRTFIGSILILWFLKDDAKCMIQSNCSALIHLITKGNSSND